jgi:hypothetical protein
VTAKCYAKDPARKNAASAKHAIEYKARRAELDALKDPAVKARIHAAWRARKPGYVAAALKQWFADNPGRRRAINAARRAAKKQACPSWVDRRALLDVYAACPEGLTVDHIVPLQNKIVCGLHVPWNLQYLTQAENLSKGNRFDAQRG